MGAKCLCPAMPLNRLLPILLLPLATFMALRPASADIYTWTDASGQTTYSDTPPPRNANLIGILRAPPPAEDAGTARQAAQQAELQAMGERIRQLERDVRERDFRLSNPLPAPPPVPYTGPAPACEPGGFACGPWGPPFLSGPVVTIVRPLPPYPRNGAWSLHGRHSDVRNPRSRDTPYRKPR